MTDPIDKSLLDRLQALRGGTGASPVRTTTTKISIDPIERRSTPTREDALAARLKSLRDQDTPSPSSAKPSPKVDKSAVTPVSFSASPVPSAAALGKSAPQAKPKEPDDEDIDAVFQTDDQTLEELLGDVGPDEGFQVEPDDAKVKALLEELADSIPKDVDESKRPTSDDKYGADPDADSDDEDLKRDVDDVLARFRDELELEKDDSENEEETRHQDAKNDDADKVLPSVEKESDFSLPDLPSTLEDLPPPPQSNRAASTDLDDLTARMAALRSSTNTDPMLDLPEVPTDAPSKKSASAKSFKRLTSRTNYTDDDVDSWCTVCLEDATLRCLGCDDDVYCTRCWREMHIGPQAGFDERSHKAVQFTRDKKKEEKRKIALGA